MNIIKNDKRLPDRINFLENSIKMIQKETENLRRDLNRQILLSLKFSEIIRKNEPDLDINDIINQVDKEEFILDENVGCVIISFGDASKNANIGGVFIPDNKFPIDPRLPKTVIYVGFSDNLQKDIDAYSILKKDYENIIDFEYTKICFPKQFISYNKLHLDKFIKKEKDKFIHTDILGYRELKDEYILLVENSYLTILKAFVSSNFSI